MRRAFILFLVYLCFNSLVFAHEIRFNELNGAKLCVASNSVQVDIRRASRDIKENNQNDDVTNEAAESELQSSLEKHLIDTLTLYEIPFVEKAKCGNHKHFVYALYFVNWNEDTNGIPYLINASSVQVGRVPSNLNADPERILPDMKFDNYYSALLFEEEIPETLHIGLSETTEEMMVELATSWWESAELSQAARQANQSRYLRFALAGSVLLSSIIIAGGLAFKERQKT